jgi:hypothetical protein
MVSKFDETIAETGSDLCYILYQKSLPTRFLKIWEILGFRVCEVGVASAWRIQLAAPLSSPMLRRLEVNQMGPTNVKCKFFYLKKDSLHF